MPKIIRSQTPKKSADACPPEDISPVTRKMPEEVCVPKHRCHIHWAIFIAVSLVALGAIIYVGRPDSTTLKASDVANNPSITEPTAPAVPKLKGVLGTVTDIGTDSITVTGVESSNKGGDVGASFTILFNDETQFVYHPVTSTPESAQKTFGTKKGSFKDIKVGMYLSAGTFDDIAPSAPITATEIGYSEESPKPVAAIPSQETQKPTPPETVSPASDAPAQPTEETVQPVEVPAPPAE